MRPERRLVVSTLNEHVRPLLLLIAVVVALLVPTVSTARAQGWSPDRDRIEGPGLRVGRLEIHPGIASEMGYDSNVFLQDEDRVSSGILRLTGHLEVSTLGVQRRTEGEDAPAPQQRRLLSFRGGVAGAYHQFTHSRARNNVGVDAYVDAVWNRDGRVSFRLANDYSRTIRPFTDPTPIGTRTPSYVRHQNTSSAQLSVGSRGGTVQGVVGYHPELHTFRDVPFSYLDSLTHRINSRAVFRFLPRTALVQTNDIEVQRYLHPGGRPASMVNDNVRVASTLGINGSVTERIALTLSGGYSVGFFDEGDDFQSWNAHVEGRYHLTPLSAVSLGYFRRFNSSFIGNFVRSDRVYAQFKYMVDGRLLLRTQAHVSFDETGTAFVGDGMTPLGNLPNRRDVRLRFQQGAEYRFTTWLGMIAEVSYLQSLTDYEFVLDASDPTGPFADPRAAFLKFEGWLGVRAFY